MKKQILFLAFFTLALIFAGTNSVFGQALSPSPYSSVPDLTPNCVGTPQQPKAGIPYTYQFDTDFGDGGPATEFRFWATKDPDFVSLVGTVTTFNQASDSLGRLPAKKELLDYSDNYLLVDGTTNGVEITWSPDLLARTNYLTLVGSPGTVATPTSTFVVGWATNDCTDNIKVWEIDPSPAFTVDIKVIADDTKLPLDYDDVTAEQCVDEVRAAKYNATNFNIDYHYGWDTLYYEVIAANFVTSWLPTFYLTGLDGTIQEARIDWYNSWSAARTNATTAATGFFEGGDITGGDLTGTVPLTTTETNTVDGVSMIVRVIIENHNYETLTASTIELSVAGEDATGFDITDDGTDCVQPTDAATAALDDATSRTITPRPTLDDTTDGTPIILDNGGTTTP